jgi:hypothetical protein
MTAMTMTTTMLTTTRTQREMMRMTLNAMREDEDVVIPGCSQLAVPFG